MTQAETSGRGLGRAITLALTGLLMVTTAFVAIAPTASADIPLGCVSHNGHTACAYRDSLTREIYTIIV